MEHATTLGFFVFAIIAWIVIVFTGAAAYTTRQTLRRLERKLDALLEHQGITLPPIVSEEVQKLARDPKRKTDAIKLHREQTGLGMAEAAADIEAFLTDPH